MKKILILLICLSILISCLDYEKYRIPGYAAIYFISEDINEDTGILKTFFNQNASKKIYLSLDLVLENLEHNKRVLNDRYLNNVMIYDREKKIALVDLVHDIEIKITGKKTNINVNNERIIESNKHFHIFERGKFLRIPIDTFKVSDRKCYIEIKAPNIKLQSWKAQFVIGVGETGSL